MRWSDVFAALTSHAKRALLATYQQVNGTLHYVTDSKVHGANMKPTWVLSDPDGPHVDPMNLAIRGRTVKSLQFSSKLSTRKPHLWVADLQMRCRDLIPKDNRPGNGHQETRPISHHHDLTSLALQLRLCSLALAWLRLQDTVNFKSYNLFPHAVNILYGNSGLDCNRKLDMTDKFMFCPTSI